jgi:methylated-DNA-[protein]-cysteine S-methyltransferase
MRSPSKEPVPLFTSRIKQSPLGEIWLAATQVGLAVVAWSQNESTFHEYLAKRYRCHLVKDPEKLGLAVDEISRYLSGKLNKFSLPIDWSLMRPFQQAVLNRTIAIPYGQTRSYGEIAREINHPGAARAVGRAEAFNPMPLVIPCHRVIGSDGKLRGYGGGQGLPTKEWLLQMEGAIMT